MRACHVASRPKDRVAVCEAAFGLVWCWFVFSQVAQAADVPTFGLFEQSFEHQGRYENPYAELEATARFTGPGGRNRTIPLFWDGGRTWKVRFAPDTAGTWKWSVASSDPGLDGRSGAFRTVDSDRHGGIRPMEGHPYHFQRQDGTPFWFLGDTAWALYTDDESEKHDRATVLRYIDARSGPGFNVVHSMLLSEAGWGNCGGDAFDDLKTERINPGYWQEVDLRLAYLNGKGVTGGLVLAWGDKRVNANDWREFPSAGARRRYARYVTARYAALDVYFVVAGEWNCDVRNAPGRSEEEIRREYAALGEVIRESDPHGRMIAIHPGGDASVREFAERPWMSFGDYQQTYHDLHAEILRSRNRNKPVVNAEYAYYLRDRDGDGRTDKPNSSSLASIRHATWDIAMAGGYFITGFGTTYFGGNRDPGPYDPDAVKNDDWEEQVQHVRELFAGLEWWRLEPHDEPITAAVRRGNDGRHQGVVAPPEITYWALAEPGRQYVAYVRGHDGPVEISLSKADPASYQMQQFDPRSGRFRDLGRHAGRGPIRYTPPDKQDWVLVVTASK